MKMLLFLAVALALINQMITDSFTNMPKTIVDNKWYWFRGSHFDYNYTDAQQVCTSYGLKLAYMDSTADYTEIFKLFCGQNS